MGSCKSSLLHITSVPCHRLPPHHPTCPRVHTLTPDPFLYSGVHVSLIGHDIDRIKELGQEVVKELEGKVVSEGRLGDDSAKV